MGIGVVCRDCEGHVLAALSQNVALVLWGQGIYDLSPLDIRVQSSNRGEALSRTYIEGPNGLEI